MRNILGTISSLLLGSIIGGAFCCFCGICGIGAGWMAKERDIINDDKSFKKIKRLRKARKEASKTDKEN